MPISDFTPILIVPDDNILIRKSLTYDRSQTDDRSILVLDLLYTRAYNNKLMIGLYYSIQY